MNNKPASSRVEPNSKKRSFKKIAMVLLVLLLVFVAVAAIALSVNRFRQAAYLPVAPPVLNESPGQPTLAQISFTGTAPILPKSFSSYVGGGESPDIEDLTKTFAEKLGLILDPSTKIWRNSSEEIEMYPSKTSGRVMYSFSQQESALSAQTNGAVKLKKTPIPAEKELIVTALDFLNKLDFPLLPDGNSAKIEYLTGGIEPAPTTKENAGMAMVMFGMKLESYPLYVDSHYDEPFVVTVSSEKIVTHAELPNLIPRPIKEGQLQPKPIDVAVAELKANRGVMVRVEISDVITGIFEIRSLRSAVFDKATLEYRYVSKSGRFYPFYHFYGDAQTAKGERGKLEYIVPAYISAGEM